MKSIPWQMVTTTLAAVTLSLATVALVAAVATYAEDVPDEDADLAAPPLDSAKSSSIKKLMVRSLQLMDDDGRVVATLDSDSDGPYLRMFNGLQAAQVELRLEEGTGHLRLNGDSWP